MKRVKLTKDKVERFSKKKGVYGDAECRGLYLRVWRDVSKDDPEPSASWVFRYMLNLRAKEISLGPLSGMTLDEAREKAQEARRLKVRGEHPKSGLAQRRATAGALDATF